MNLDIVKFKSAITQEKDYILPNLYDLTKSFNNFNIDTIFHLIGEHTSSDNIEEIFQYYHSLFLQIFPLLYPELTSDDMMVFALNAVILSRRSILDKIAEQIINLYLKITENTSENYSSIGLDYLNSICIQLIPYYNP